MRYPGPLLTKPMFDALLAARDAGETAWTGSLDLGRSQDLAALAADAWEWRGQRYAWVPGQRMRVRHGQQWRQPQWRQHGGRWQFEHGRWDRDRDGVPNRYDRHPNNPRRY